MDFVLLVYLFLCYKYTAVVIVMGIARDVVGVREHGSVGEDGTAAMLRHAGVGVVRSPPAESKKKT